MMKRFWIILLALLCCAAAACAEEYTEGDFGYRVDDGEAIIMDYTGSDARVEIPATLGGYPVIEIDGSGFHQCTTLEEIILPEGLEEIGHSTFYGCTGLTAVVLPKTLRCLDYGAFNGCTNLETIVMPAALEWPYIGQYATEATTTWLVLKDSYAHDYAKEHKQPYKIISPYTYRETDTGVVITDYAYLDAKEISIPAKVDGLPVVGIGERAFAGMQQLETAVLPKSVMLVEAGAFADCPSLAKVAMRADAQVDETAFDHRETITFEDRGQPMGVGKRLLLSAAALLVMGLLSGVLIANNQEIARSFVFVGFVPVPGILLCLLPLIAAVGLVIGLWNGSLL